MPHLEKSKRKLNLRLGGKLSLPAEKKDYLENTTFYLLLFIIFISAVPFGTVDLWSKSFLVVIICLVALLRILSIFFNGIALFSNGSLIFPLAGILGLAIIQIFPWSIGDLNVLSNQWRLPISADPDSTKNFILIFSGFIIASEVLFAYTNTHKRLKALIYLVLAVGLASAIFGVIRIYFFKNGQTGLSAYFDVGTGFAQFINRNHFLYLMEMTIGLLLGILIKGNLAERYNFFGWVSIGFLILISISANSRGGIISLASIFMIAPLTHFLTRNNKNTLDKKILSNDFLRKVLLTTFLGCAVFGIIVVTIAFVGGDAVATRIESIQSEVEQNGKEINRKAIWKSTWNLIKENPITGVGFGGYSAAITKYDTSSGKMSLQQAHNDYLEILANGGIIAFLLFLIFIYILTTKTFDQFKSRNYLRRSSCFGAILGISGVMIHSLVDFGLHALSNLLIFIVLIVIATANISSSEKSAKFVS